MNTPDATEVLRLLCFLVLVDGLSTVPSGILTRRFLQGRRFAADVSDFTVSTLVTIVLAIEGYGAMSFAWGRIVGGFLGVLLIWMLAPIRFRPGWDKAEAGSLLRFGLPLAGSSLLIFVLLNVDYAIVGRELSTAQLGFYLMAFNLSSWPVNLFVEAARRVSFAGFSRLAARPEHLGRSFQRGLRVLGALTIPVCAVLIGFAEPLIEVLYGERWLPAAAALEILAVLGLARAIYLLGYDALVTVGRTGALIRLQALWLALLVPALVLGARIGGIRGVSMGHVAVAVLVVLPILLRLLSRYGVSLRRVMKGFGPPIAGGAAILIAAVVVRNEVAHPFAQLAIGGSISGVLYLASTLPFRSMLLSSD